MSFPKDRGLAVSLPYVGVGKLQAITASTNGTTLAATNATDATGIRIWLQGGSVTFYIGPAGVPPIAPLTPPVTWAAADGPILDIPLDASLDVFFTAITGNPVGQRM